MKQILHFDWLPKRARGSSCQFRISCIGSANRSSLFGHIISPLLSKLARSRWLYIGLVFLCVFLLTSSWSWSIKPQKRTWPKSSHLDPTLWVNNIYFIYIGKPKRRVPIHVYSNDSIKYHPRLNSV